MGKYTDDDDGDESVGGGQDADVLDDATKRENDEILRAIDPAEWDRVWKLAHKLAKALVGKSGLAMDLCNDTYVALREGQGWRGPGKSEISFELHTLRVMRGLAGHDKRGASREERRDTTAGEETKLLRMDGRDSPERAVIQAEDARRSRIVLDALIAKLAKGNFVLGINIVEQYAKGDDTPAAAAEALGRDVKDVNAELRRMRRYAPGIYRGIDADHEATTTEAKTTEKEKV